MKKKPAKHPRPFGLRLDPDDALERFIRTDPVEVEELIARSKTKKPPGAKRKRKASAGSAQEVSENVVSLRRRRMRKRNEGR
jgi:hypothetical protein